MMTEFKNITLSSGELSPIPEKYYPWVMEYTWTYDPVMSQVYRIENGRTIYLYNEFVKHQHPDDNLVLLSDNAIDALFSDHPAYEKLVEEYGARVQLDFEGTTYRLPNPYTLIGMCLTATLSTYFKWLGSNKAFLLNLEGVPEFSSEAREDNTPYVVAEEYPILKDWMYGEWSGELSKESAPKPLTFSSEVHDVVIGAMGAMIEQENDGASFEEIIEFFEHHEKSLFSIAELIQFIIESYPTPAR